MSTYYVASSLLVLWIIIVWWETRGWGRQQQPMHRNNKYNSQVNSIGNGFPGGSVVKNLSANAGSVPDPGRSHMSWSN